MEFFHIEKPNLKQNEARFPIEKLFEQSVSDFVHSANEPEYKYWDRVKYQMPRPDGFSAEAAWASVRFIRRGTSKKTPIKDVTGHDFSWVRLDMFDRICSDLDLHTGGELRASVDDLRGDEKKKMIASGLMEESIASAQLEGADTGRAHAKKILRENIEPKGESEIMIVNNHKAMNAVEDKYKKQKMSLDLLDEIHKILTDDTLDAWGNVPHRRGSGDEPVVVADDAVSYYEAPDQKFSNAELVRFVAFANDELDDEKSFTHPIIKATMLHFWIGYLHPYTDGNGRLARLVFYWYLLRKGYWAFAYLPIAAKIKSGGKKAYTMAYVYSEQDSNDMTYFISYILKKIAETQRSFAEYVIKTRNKNGKFKSVLASGFNLNDRQVDLLTYLVADKSNSVAIASAQTMLGVSRITATADLNKLKEVGLISSKKIGMTNHYHATVAAIKLLEK